MGIRRISWTLLLLFVLSAPVLAAALPGSLDDIPLYPGAVRDQDLEQEYLDSMYFSDDVMFHEIRAYRVKTILDDVASFYVHHFQPAWGWPEEDPYNLAPGESQGPWYEPDFYRSDLFEDQYEYDTLIHDGKWVRSAFASRPQWEPGEWLIGVAIQWVIAGEDGELIHHVVYVEDEGYDWRARVDFKATRLYLETMVIERDYENWDDGWDEDWDDEWDDDWGSDDDWGWGMADISLEAPTEELLGIPFYPGMAFNVQLSEAMSMEDYHYYVFFSPDPQDQVVDFYKRHLGKEPLFSEGDYLFALKGKLPMPDDGLAVQINQFFTGFGQTMITVAKKMGD